MANKPKVAFYWCASCGGCEEAVVDLAEGVLDVVAAVDIVFWPVALDFKVEDVEAMKDGSITVSFINGAIRLSEQEEMAKLLRRKSQVVIAFGSCSHLGGIPGLAARLEAKFFTPTRETKEAATVRHPPRNSGTPHHHANPFHVRIARAMINPRSAGDSSQPHRDIVRASRTSSLSRRT